MDEIELIIHQELNKLPKYCRYDYGTHEWVECFNPKDYPVNNGTKSPSVWMPYRICKHCHKREEMK